MNEKTVIRSYPLDKLPVKYVDWCIQRTDIEGIEGCQHDLLCITAYPKSSTLSAHVMNDNTERVVHAYCSKCDFVGVFFEYITHKTISIDDLRKNHKISDPAEIT